MTNEAWIKNWSEIVDEDQDGITICSRQTGDVVLRIKPGDYRKNSDGMLEVRVGSRAEFLKGPDC
ncbi:MAG: hypothetical protein HY226_05910 [Candidatus Vogelbacteria bacterium]|nr:hypothetical protein [Candidatus Vogelbacteria bacterium]